MSVVTRRILFSFLALTIVACLCLSILGISGAGVIIYQELVSSVGQETPAPQIVLDLDQQMDEIQQQVIELRELQPTGPVERALLTPDDLRQRVLDDFLEDYTAQDARDDALTLAAFGLLDPDFDLQDLYLELFAEQIAGFYDNEAKEMCVVQGAGFQGPERMTYAHEYVHVLQDQNYDIGNGLGYSDEACEEDSERCAAVQALIEGDATLLELTWYGVYATSADQQQLLDFYRDFESPVYDSAPEILQKSFLFPYEAGQEFVQFFFDQGGWERIAQIYQNPPVSTEQILHPERYPDDVPTQVEIPDLTGVLGDGWRELDRNVMGEWYTYLILAHGLDEDARLSTFQAEAAAEGWGGDAYVVYYNEQQDATVMVLKTWWDSPSEADEFGEAFKEYAHARFDESNALQAEALSWTFAGGYTELHSDVEASETVWLLAPNEQMAQSIWAVLQNP